MSFIPFIIVNTCLGALGAWAIAALGFSLGFVDYPSDRGSHPTVTPKGGGVGILAAFLASAWFLHAPLSLWLPAAALALVSLYGDRSELPPRYRLIAQLAASAVTVSACIMPASPVLANAHLTSPYTLFAWGIAGCLFIMATANFFNFMDGINGIAGITGLVGFGLIALYAEAAHAPVTLRLIPLGISLACLGFLPFNAPRARTFMGDVGSILLGFLFAVLVLMLSRSLFDFVILASFILPFYLDAITTIMVRIKDRDNLLKAHRKHLYQLFANELNVPHWQVSLAYGTVQLTAGISILAFRSMGLLWTACLISLYTVGFCLLSRHIRARTALLQK